MAVVANRLCGPILIYNHRKLATVELLSFDVLTIPTLC